MTRRARLTLMLGGLAVAAAACVPPTPPTPPPPSSATPNLQVTSVVTGANKPWDVDWAPDGTMLFTMKGSGLYAKLANGQVRHLTNGGADLWVSGETGMMGMAVDPSFASNRRVVTCQGSTDNDFTVQVVGWRIAPDWSSATRVNDPLVGNIDGRTGRHGGCRVEFGAGGVLWVTTGDAAVGSNPQNLASLNGKVLKVNAATGAALPGAPIGLPGTDARIWTFGHRNVQGIAFRANGQVFTSEHGPSRDDEVNVIVAGRNYGWNPVPGYNEAVPMTDTRLFNVQGAAWSSGSPTLAVSGMTFLSGSQWKGWNGALAVATLKASKLLIQTYDNAGRFTGQQVPAALNGTYGRLRTAQQGPDGCLYIPTDNGSNDRILRVCPS